MLIELFFVGYNEDDAIVVGMVFDDYKSAEDYNLDEFGGDAKVFSATVGVNANDLSEVTE